MKRVEKFLREDVCPGLRRHATFRRGPGAEASGHRAWTRPAAMTLGGSGRVGMRRPASLPEEMRPMAREHLRVVPDSRLATADGLGAGLPDARSGGGHPLHRRAPADAAGPRSAQPYHRRAVCAGRALHRPASVQHCQVSPGCYARPGRRRKLRACWSTTTRRS